MAFVNPNTFCTCMDTKHFQKEPSGSFSSAHEATLKPPPSSLSIISQFDPHIGMGGQAQLVGIAGV